MNNNLEQRKSGSLREKTQYGLTFGVIAMMLFVANFPIVVIFFFGIFAYFLWKTFSASPHSGVRHIFEFYLNANSILRDDEREWFGFEIQEAIEEGERVLRVMHGAPPLVYFALGALYNKIGNHENAVKHLSYVVEDSHSGEASYVHPSSDLRRYVKTLRGIELEPKSAPQTSAAVRSLERARRNRGKLLLEESRDKIREENLERQKITSSSESAQEALSQAVSENILLRSVTDKRVPQTEQQSAHDARSQNVRRKPPSRPGNKPKSNDDDLFSERKPITEVLHDIYDKNVQ